MVMMLLVMVDLLYHLLTRVSIILQDASELPDWRLPLSFMKARHTEKIEGLSSAGDCWRVKDRV